MVLFTLLKLAFSYWTAKSKEYLTCMAVKYLDKAIELMNIDDQHF